MASFLEKYGALEYSTPFILMNVMTMITILPGNLLPLQMAKGQRKSSDGVAAFCNQHIYNWGMCCGVRNGDQYDCFQVILVLILKLAGWAPYKFIQLYVALASSYWCLNMVIINLSNIAGAPRFATNPTPPAIAAFFVFMSNFELFTVLWRGLQFVPDGSTTLLLVWFWICVLWMMRVAFRIATLQSKPLWIYMIDVMFLRDAHVAKGNTWKVNADDPEDFDLARISAKSMEHMMDQLNFSGLPKPGDMSTADGINKVINDFIESETVPMSVWLPVYLLVVVVLAALPFVCCAA